MHREPGSQFRVHNHIRAGQASAQLLFELLRFLRRGDLHDRHPFRPPTVQLLTGQFDDSIPGFTAGTDLLKHLQFAILDRQDRDAPEEKFELVY